MNVSSVAAAYKNSQEQSGSRAKECRVACFLFHAKTR